MAALANDPARFKSAFVGAGGVEPGYAARAMTFNKALYEPSDTRAQTAQMPAIAPSPLLTGWQQPQAPAAVNRYGTASVKSASALAGAPNPNLGGDEFTQNTAATIPAWLAADSAASSPALATAQSADNPNLGPGGTEMDAMTTPAAPTLLTGNSRPTDLTHPLIDSPTSASGNSSASSRPAGEMDGAQLTAKAREIFMAKGGSQRTWNRGMAAAGVKPQIDARATQSPRNDSAGASGAIRSQWGWGADQMSLPY